MSDTWFFDVLPCRPEPYEDECLSGYLLRLAAANNTANFRNFVLSLFSSWSDHRQISILRWEYPVGNWDELSQRVQLSSARLSRMTLLPWVTKFRVPPANDDQSFSPGRMLRGIVRPTLQVCPLCLQEKPYQRILWRLQSVMTCVEHGCWLQGTCHACGQVLSVVSNYQQHLYCNSCGEDLRRLPTLPASAKILTEEARQQPDWHYLLNPTVSLINESEAIEGCSLSRLVGLKLRYLRHQTGLSPQKIARQIEPSASQIRIVEHGWQERRVPLAAYLTYLEGLGYSWRAFAALMTPAEFFSKQLQPQYMSLRICPSVNCPNHQPPPSSDVVVRRYFPERGLIVLKCKACKRKFTRTYAGELVTKCRRPPLPPGTQVNMHKPATEIEQARQLGLQGRSNRHITQCLGWTQETIRNCWKALGIEADVHAAQKQRRRQKSQKHRETLQIEVEKILEYLCQQDERITFVGVTQALGRRAVYIFRYPDVACRVREVAVQHHAWRKQRHFEALQTKVKQVIAECRENGTMMSQNFIARQADSTPWQLQHNYPELWDIVRQAVAADKDQRRAKRLIQQHQQVNEAAARLISRGMRLSKSAIIKEARKLNPISTTQVNGLLETWVSGFDPGN